MVSFRHCGLARRSLNAIWRVTGTAIPEDSAVLCLLMVSAIAARRLRAVEMEASEDGQVFGRLVTVAVGWSIP